MENREELEPIASNKTDEYQNSCNVTRKGTKRKISQIVEQMDFTGNGYYHGPYRGPYRGPYHGGSKRGRPFSESEYRSF